MDVDSSFPPFDLANQDSQRVRSDDRHDWMLVYWYPMADTPGCTAQAEGLRDQYESFADLNCTIYGVSFDEPETNRTFRADHRLPFNLLSDTSRTAALAQGVVAEASARVAPRVAFLVRPDGRVAARYDVADPEFFAEDVLDDLERLTAAEADGRAPHR